MSRVNTVLGRPCKGQAQIRQKHKETDEIKKRLILLRQLVLFLVFDFNFQQLYTRISELIRYFAQSVIVQS
jgi:hypothetical protein